MKKMKVVWLCHFGNTLVAKELGVMSDSDFAPWIMSLLTLFEPIKEIDLHLVCPNYYTNTDAILSIKGATIHCYKYKILPLSRRFETLPISHLYAKRKVQKIIRDINPDIVHLHGSENPIYSEASLGLISKYPVLVTIQGFISLSAIPKNPVKRFVRFNRVRIERAINSTARYITAATSDVKKVLKDFTDTAIIYNDHYPTTVPNVTRNALTETKYDYVYYARVTKAKGIEEFIDAVYILRKERPDLKALVIGGASAAYKEYISLKVKKLGLEHTIVFAGFQKTQEDVFALAVTARIYILPTHFDGIPGSIRECMFMKIPIIASAVGGIPTFNDAQECITLVEPKNVPDLVEKIKLVESDPERTAALVENAYKLITGTYDNTKIPANMIRIYQDILKRESKTV